MSRREREGKPELEPQLVAAYAATFIPRWDRYPGQRVDGSYTAVKQPLTLSLVEAHLLGQATIGMAGTAPPAYGT